MALRAEKGPFAVYYQAVEERLVGLSQAGGAAPRKALERPAPSERKIAPAITIADFALKSWGGRDTGITTAEAEKAWQLEANRRLRRPQTHVAKRVPHAADPDGMVLPVLAEFESRSGKPNPPRDLAMLLAELADLPNSSA